MKKLASKVLLRRHRSYENYRGDFEIENLERVPSHWKTKRLKAVATFNDEVLSEDGDPLREILYIDISGVDPVRGILRKEQLTFAKAPTRARRVVRNGDVIISTVRTYLRAITAIQGGEDNLIVSTGFAVIRPGAEIDGDFLAYALRAPYFIDRAIAGSVGVSFPATSASEIACLSIAVPPPLEQRSIVTFLDSETAKIDRLIDSKERLVSLLEEKLATLIAQAVTKGLNLDVPVEDSSVEWFGEIPAHWELTRVKYVVCTPDGIQLGPFGSMLKDLAHEPTPYKLYGQENIISNDFGVGSRWLDEDHFMRLLDYQLIPGDVVLTRKGSTGYCRIVPEGIALGIIDSDTIRVRPGGMLNAEFLALLVQSSYVEAQVQAMQKGAVLPGLNTSTIEDLRIALPPLDEQKDILRFIRRKSEMIQCLTESIRRAIRYLTELRMALISAAVTGEIDVREGVP